MNALNVYNLHVAMGCMRLYGRQKSGPAITISKENLEVPETL